MARGERVKNATRNIVFGIMLKIYQILVPFLMRTVMIYFMGVQYLGLNSLFVSVLQVLNLAEFGVGSAMVYSMYKPIAENDATSICALLKMYKIYYRVIGLVIAIVGCAITPFVPKLISGEIPSDINIYALFLMNLGVTVLSYWLFAYKNSILFAHQRTDVVSKVTLITNTFQYLLQFLVLWAFHNYYFYVVAMLVTQALNNIILVFVSNKLYPQYQPLGKVSDAEVRRINGRIRDLFTSKIGGIIYDSSDTIVASAFLGLTVLAVYQNYYYIVRSLMEFITVIFVACTAGIGNSIAVETKEKNFNDFIKFTFIICWISGFCSVCLICLFQPFMELWVGKDLMLGFSAVICFAGYFYIRQINNLLNLYKDASGMWHEDRFRPLAASMTNLTLNLILVQFMGIYGILLSSVIAMLLVGIPWLLHNLFTVVFERRYLFYYLKKLFFYLGIVILSCVVTYFVCSRIVLALIPTLFVRGIICVVVPNVIYFLMYRKFEEYQQALVLADHMTNGRMKKELRILGMRKSEDEMETDCEMRR